GAGIGMIGNFRKVLVNCFDHSKPPEAITTFVALIVVVPSAEATSTSHPASVFLRHIAWEVFAMRIPTSHAEADKAPTTGPPMVRTPTAARHSTKAGS